VILGAVFLFASYDKIAKPQDFARIIYHYQVIGPSQTIPPLIPNLVAVVLPWVEALAGALLLLGIWRREAALVVALLLLTFLGAVGSALYRGIDVENCGCFTVSGRGRRAGAGLIAGDLGLLIGACLLALPGAAPTRRAAPSRTS